MQKHNIILLPPPPILYLLSPVFLPNLSFLYIFIFISFSCLALSYVHPDFSFLLYFSTNISSLLCLSLSYVLSDLSFLVYLYLLSSLTCIVLSRVLPDLSFLYIFQLISPHTCLAIFTFSQTPHSCIISFFFHYPQLFFLFSRVFLSLSFWHYSLFSHVCGGISHGMEEEQLSPLEWWGGRGGGRNSCLGILFSTLPESTSPFPSLPAFPRFLF